MKSPWRAIGCVSRNWTGAAWRSSGCIGGRRLRPGAGRADDRQIAGRSLTRGGDAERMICCTLREDLLVEVSKLAREGRFDYLLVESTGLSEPLPGAEPRLGRRTVLTFPLLPPPQKN